MNIDQAPLSIFLRIRRDATATVIEMNRNPKPLGKFQVMEGLTEKYKSGAWCFRIYEAPLLQGIGTTKERPYEPMPTWVETSDAYNPQRGVALTFSIEKVLAPDSKYITFDYRAKRLKLVDILRGHNLPGPDGTKKILAIMDKSMEMWHKHDVQRLYAQFVDRIVAVALINGNVKRPITIYIEWEG